MIEGAVNAAHKAVVTLPLQGPEGRTRDIQTVIDTGYTGTSTLPAAVVAELRLPFSHMGWAFPANDVVVSFDVHDATVLWDSQPRHVKVDAIGNTPLRGNAAARQVQLQHRSRERGPGRIAGKGVDGGDHRFN